MRAIEELIADIKRRVGRELTGDERRASGLPVTAEPTASGLFGEEGK